MSGSVRALARRLAPSGGQPLPDSANRVGFHALYVTGSHTLRGGSADARHATWPCHPNPPKCAGSHELYVANPTRFAGRQGHSGVAGRTAPGFATYGWRVWGGEGGPGGGARARPARERGPGARAGKDWGGGRVAG